VIRSSETSVDIWITRRYIPEDGNIQTEFDYRCYMQATNVAVLVPFLRPGHCGDLLGFTACTSCKSVLRFMGSYLVNPRDWKVIL
jgi:hypothetical protein